MSRKLEDAHPDLQRVFLAAKERWKIGNPDLPQPVLTQTYRSNEEQQRLYNYPTDKLDNNGNGKVDEKGEKVTNLRSGGAHNYYPSRAIDVAFVLGKKTYWDLKYYVAFSEYMLKAAKREKVEIEWGGAWKSFPDAPHYQLKNFRSIK